MTLGLFADDGSGGAAPEREGVGFWLRALARAIDTLIHIFVSLVTGLATGLLVIFGAAIQGGSPDAAIAKLSADNVLGFVAALIGAIALHVFSEGLHGSSIGKRLCGITVVAEDGSPATLLAALKRNLLYFFDSFFFGWVAARKMGESPKRQRHGDVWGRTMVVRIATLDPSARRSWPRFAVAALLGLAADGLVLFLELASRLIA
jgi:uncharacterized RDD family membrane protein YckC